MRRLMALAAIAAVAAGATASIVLTSQAATATPSLPSNTGQGSGAICVEHLPNNTYRACVAVDVDGSISAGHAAGNGSIRVEQPDTGGIARFQIDRVAIGTQHAGITSSRSVNSGPTPKPISASTTGADPYYTRCDVRYHVELDFAVRLTNGQLKLGSFVGPWFDSGYAPCAGSDYVAPVRDLRCMLRYPDVQKACVQVEVSAATSNDGKSFYARGTVTVPDDVVGSDQIARVQVDHAVLGQQSAAVRISPSMNSRDRHPLSAMGETTPGFAWSRDCAKHYQAALEYSVRLKDGRLFHGRITTPTFNAPGC